MTGCWETVYPPKGMVQKTDGWVLLEIGEYNVLVKFLGKVKDSQWVVLRCPLVLRGRCCSIAGVHSSPDLELLSNLPPSTPSTDEMCFETRPGK